MGSTLRLHSLGLLVLMALITQPAQGVQWRLDRSLQAGGDYRNNSRDTAGVHGTGLRANLRPQAHLSMATGRTSLDASADYSFDRYSAVQGGNEDSRSVALRTDYRTARQLWKLDGSLRTSSHLYNVLDETGVVSADTVRTQRLLQPSWTWMITGKNSFNLGLSHSNVSYSNAQNSSLRDYTSRQASATFSRQHSGKTQVYGSVSWSFFEFDDKSNESTSISSDVGFSHDLTPRWTVGGSMGRRSTKSTQRSDTPIGIIIDGVLIVTDIATVESENDNSGTIYSANIKRSFAKGELSADMNRSVGVSGTNGQVISNSFRVNGRWRFGPRWTVVLNGTLTKSENAAQVTSSLDRTTSGGLISVAWKPRFDISVSGSLGYLKQEPLNDSVIAPLSRISPALSINWNYQRHWKFSASYRYSSQDGNNTTTSEQVHTLALTLSHTWPTMTFSQ